MTYPFRQHLFSPLGNQPDNHQTTFGLLSVSVPQKHEYKSVSSGYLDGLVRLEFPDISTVL